MTCPKTDSFLFQYFTGDPATRAKLLKEPHLSTCSDCSEKLSECERSVLEFKKDL